VNPFQNHDPLAPLVSVIVAMHEGDMTYWPRALASLRAQDMPHDQIEVLIAFDGPVTDEAAEFLESASADADFNIELYAAETGQEPTGYYTIPRNRALTYAHGYYIANLDVDNEFRPDHLSGLLTAIRLPGSNGAGWPHFVYSRIHYVRDEGAPENLPVGDSILVPWDKTAIASLAQGPMSNFIDTSCFLAGKSVFYALAEATGTMWNPTVARFGDWELVLRLALKGFRGLAVDQPSLAYHWTGKNLQLTRRADEMVALSLEQANVLREEGSLVQ